MITRDEIMAMQAGPELDRHMAEFMGMPFSKPTHGSCCTCQTCGWDYDNCQCGYGEDIEMAFQVVEKLRTTDPFNAGARFAETIAEMTDADQDDYMADAFNLIFGLSPLVISKAALMTTIR